MRRRLATVVISLLLTALLVVGGRMWNLHFAGQDLGRARLYARAIDEEVAKTADADIAKLFVRSAPSDVDTSGRAVAPCDVGAPRLQEIGAKDCSLFEVASIPEPAPWFCKFATCVYLAVPSRAWAEARIRATAKRVLGDPDAACQVFDERLDREWFGPGVTPLECTSLRIVRGKVYVVPHSNWAEP